MAQILRHIDSRKSALTTMIVSNLIILLIPLSMGLFLYSKVEQSLKISTTRANSVMLVQLKQSLDNKLSEVEMLKNRIVFDPKLEYLLKVPAESDSTDKYRFVEFAQDMGRYRNMVSTFIFDYYVYFATSDTLVRSDQMTDSRSFYSAGYTFKDKTYDQWRKELLTSVHAMSYMPVTPLARGLNPLAGTYDLSKEVIVYAQTLPIHSQTENLGQFIVLIDVDHIKQLFAQLESFNHSMIYIIDKAGRTIMSTSDRPFPSDLLKKTDKETGTFEYKIDGVDQMVSFASSQNADWKYVTITPNDVFMQQVNLIQHWASWLFVLCLVAGLIAVYFAAYRNYKPLQHTVNAIMRGKDMDRRDASNEYEFIRQTFEGTIYEENYLRKTLTGQIPHIQANYLSRLLLGYTDVDLSAENKESLRFMNLTFISDRFTILLAKIEDIQYFAEEGSEQQWALARFIVSNVGVDLIEQGHKGFAIELEQDRIAFIINLVDEQEVDHEADIREIAKMLYGVITQKFNINLTLAVGDIHQGMKAIRNSYPEALAALEYRLILGKNSIIHFKDIIETKQHYYYPLEVEIQLTNLVRSGDTVNVEKLLERVFAMNFNSNHITPELGKCLFFNLTSTLLKIINSTNVMQDEVFGDEMDPIKVVFSDTTVQGMQMKVKELYETLTRSLNVERTDHNIQLLQAIIDLVNDKIGDPELGLAMIADSFQMTQPYISTFFKKNQGQNLQDYIMSKRMESAKRLMEDKELTISQIAQRVGYNDVVFIRAFKKLEGIPPGKYRETMLPDKSNSGK